MKCHFPTDRYYDRTHHTWAQRERDVGRVIIGIHALGLMSLGDLTHVVLPTIGSRIARGKACGTVEAAKMTVELVPPLSGTVLARNEAVLRDPSLTNRDNYGQGWLLVIKADKWRTEHLKLVPRERVSDWVKPKIKCCQEQ